MRIRLNWALLGAALMLAGCSTPDGGAVDYSTAALDTDDQKASYGIGLNVGESLAETKNRLDRAAFMRGIEDAMARKEPAIPGEEIQTVLQAFAAAVQADANTEMVALAETNAAAGGAYMTENGAREGVMTTASGLQYEVLREGEGDPPGPDDQASMHYRGTLIDGTEFDTSYGGDPAQFAVGGVIQGFSEGLMLMAPGSHYRFVIPGDLAYGPNYQRGMIGPSQTLIFEVEMIGVVGR